MNRRTNKILSIATRQLNRDLLYHFERTMSDFTVNGFRPLVKLASDANNSKIKTSEKEIEYICNDLYKQMQLFIKDFRENGAEF